MSERQLICIGCPLGCMLTATLENGTVTAPYNRYLQFKEAVEIKLNPEAGSAFRG